jgi:hypothetical protein
MKVPLSDHFDGNRFFNPTLPKGFAPSRLDAIKMAREPHSQWPTWVKNTGVHRLNEMRAADEIAAITFVNHATFLIETGGITILTDPIWSERASPFRGIGPKRVRAPGVAFEDIPRVDVILTGSMRDAALTAAFNVFAMPHSPLLATAPKSPAAK